MGDRISLVINDLKEELRENTERGEMLKTTIANLEKLSGSNLPRQLSLQESAPIQTAVLPMSSGAYSGLGIAEAAIKYLRTVGKAQKTAVIADALKKGGAKSTNHYRAVYNSLKQHGNYVTIDDQKRWSLKEWSE